MKRKYAENEHENGNIRKKRKGEGLKQGKKNIEWLKGTLCPTESKGAWFIKPFEELPRGYNKFKDVFMYPKYISEYVLTVKAGDKLEFLLGDRDKTRPFAYKVRIFRYSSRTCKELTEYIMKLSKDLETKKEALMKVLPCTAMWSFLGSPEFKFVTDEQTTLGISHRVTYVDLLLKLLQIILENGRKYKALLEEAIMNIAQGMLFQATNNQSLPEMIKSCPSVKNNHFYFEEDKASLSAELVRSFCHSAVEQVPVVISFLLPTVIAISQKISSPSMQNFLCNLLSLNITGGNGFVANASIWRKLPLIPTDHELAGHLVERDKNLMPVRTRIPYDNPEQYMDIYFRLVRAETFSAIQHGIKDLKASTLDLRDMNVYYNIHLAGLELQNGRFSIALHFTPVKKVRRWEASPQLMHGNLVCVSLNRQFDDVIWATVSIRDTRFLNDHQIIMLELLDENMQTVGEVINSLQTQEGSGVMVESPTYYHSLSPVLQSLKQFDMESFPLQEEIVYARHASELPSYLKKATFETAIVCSPENTCTEAPGNALEEGEILGASELASQLLEANGQQSLKKTEVNDCVSSEDEISRTCDERNNNECNVKEKFTLEMHNVKPVLNISCQREETQPNDNLAEQMDTNCTPEDSLHSKVEQSADEESHLQGKLGGRMNVERFLETFNSSSVSSLEESQRNALIHVLKNKLAIIQGPPGCGKTFIGVKIVQLLLSLTPKLDKPILLLTYKNHALDEFLKQTLLFCNENDLVRIGSRSKEPELVSCKLNQILNYIPYDKETSADIANKRYEMENIESEIRKILKKIEPSSYLTKTTLVDDLSEEQIRSLITEADWGNSMVYRVSRRYNADKRWMKRLVDDVAKQHHGSVKNFLQTAFEHGLSRTQDNRCDSDCMDVFNQVFQEWFPGRRELKKLKAFQADFVLPIQTSTTDTSEESHDADDDDSGDEDHVKHLLERRMEAGAGQTLRDDFILFDIYAKNKWKVLVHISDYPPDMVASTQISSVNNLWSLDEVERLKFLYSILNGKTTSVSQKLNDLIKQLQNLKKLKNELEMSDKVKFLSQKKIIGATITGASINHDLLHHIGPNVVIVEEAAEILEPSLLAALTPSIEHLILIGDHKQLRPQVDTYELCKKYKLDVSMMERLIESKFPFESLAKQNRMRPEFSALLHDIYPKLEDNLPLVSKNQSLKCVKKSMFFWSHEDPEKKDRTFTNFKEAERVIALVRYLLYNGVPPSDITVLAAYLGQTKLLRNMIKRQKWHPPHFSHEFDKHTKEQEGFVQVQTIDMYQGDENKYIIVSLVRSNKENNIGFLKILNRRCVAQSRAKCGMYFLGNPKTLCGAKNSCWSELINAMRRQECVGDEFPLQCIKHKTSMYKVKNSDDIQQVIDNPALLCEQPCGDQLWCGLHFCTKPCHQKHSHILCPVYVDDQFPDCGHYVKRKCQDSLLSLTCMTEESVDLPCGHEGKKKCYQDISDIECKLPVNMSFPKCGHEDTKLCYEKIETLSCRRPCKEVNSCGKHRCKAVCGNIHGHETCSVMVNYSFPECGHPSQKKKKCTEAITWDCTYTVSFTGSCGHEIQKECHQSENDVACGVKPCTRVRKCGHPCQNACGEDCDKGDCKDCFRVYRKKMQEFREAAKQRVKELNEKIEKKEIPSFSRDELRSIGPTAAEYQKVKDQVLKFIQPCHNWFPTITKIERVTNLKLEKKFEAAKSRAFGYYIDTKFHGTSDNGLENIIQKGFKMPEANPKPPKKRGMYGQGIYFATDSSKSARSIYTQGSQKLLLCQVILGKTMTVEKADNTLNRKKLRFKNCDSVYAPRGTAVINDEFVIFDPDQALPQYIIHFSDSKKLVPPSPSLHTKQSFFVKNMKASRSVNFQDPFEMYYSWAESHFRRMAATGKPPLSQHQATISSIDIVINKDLEDKFEATRKTFQSQGIPDKEILAYHGTDKKNIDSILKSNLQLSYAKRQMYGRGNYFSEYPSVSLGYGDGLLLCRILPGKEFVDASDSNIPDGHNSKKVLLGGQSASSTGAATAVTANVSGEMIIIEKSDQILPFFVIHR